jgi:hypothetical protein
MHTDASIGVGIGHAPKEFVASTCMASFASTWIILALAFEFLSSASLSCHTKVSHKVLSLFLPHPG